MILCDTDILIEFLKGKKEIKGIFEKEEICNIVISSVTIMELFFGALNQKEIKEIEKFISCFKKIKINEKITDLAIDLIRTYAKSHNLRIPDALIAATAISNDYPLLTNNKKDFKYIKSIELF